VAHYVIRVAGPTERSDDGSQLQLSVTSDDTAQPRVVWVRAAGVEQGDEAWGAILEYGVEQIEFGFRGQNWGVEIEDAAPLLVEVTKATATHLVDESKPRAALDVGGTVGEFDL
jgi:hypothetical protein